MGKFITVYGQRAQNFLKKEQPKKWKQLMQGGMETTRAEASNAEACHAEATNNYTDRIETSIIGKQIVHNLR